MENTNDTDIEFDYSYFLPEGIADDDYDDTKLNLNISTIASPGIRLNPNATEFKEKTFKPMEYNYSNFTPNFLRSNNIINNNNVSNNTTLTQQQLFVQQQNALKLSNMKNFNGNTTATLEMFNQNRTIGLGSSALNTPSTMSRKPPIAPTSSTYLNNNNIQNQLTNFMVQLQTNQIHNYSPNTGIGNLSPGISPGFGGFGSNPYNSQPSSPTVSDNSTLLSAASVFDSIATLQLRNQESTVSQPLPFNSHNLHGNTLTVPTISDNKFVSGSNRRLSANVKKDFTSFADMAAASSSKSEATKVESRKSVESKVVESININSSQSTYASLISKVESKPDTPKIENLNVEDIEPIKLESKVESTKEVEPKVESKAITPKADIVVVDYSLKNRKTRQSPIINTQSNAPLSPKQQLSPAASNTPTNVDTPLNDSLPANEGLTIVKSEKSRSITEKFVEKKDITIGGSYNILESIDAKISSRPPSPSPERRKSLPEVHELSQAAINRKIKNNLRLEKEKEREREKENNKKHQSKLVVKDDAVKPQVEVIKSPVKESHKKDDVLAVGTFMLFLATFASSFFNSINLKKLVAATLKYFASLYTLTFSNDSQFWSRFVVPASSYICGYLLVILDFHHSALKIGYSDKQRLLCFFFLYAFPFLHAYNITLCLFPPWAVSFTFCLFLMISFYFGTTNNSVITTLIKSSLPLYLIFHVSSETMLTDINPGLRLTLAFLISVVRKYDISRPMLLLFTCMELLISVSIGHLFIAQWTILLGSMQMFRYLEL